MKKKIDTKALSKSTYMPPVATKRITEENHSALKKEAKKAGLSLSEYLRNQLLGKK